MAVLLPLAWPLSQALTDIARQSRTVSTVRAALMETLGDQQVRILDLHLGDTDMPTLDVTFAVQHWGEEEDERLRHALVPTLPPGSTLRFQPMVVADPVGTQATRPTLRRPVIGGPLGGPSKTVPVTP